MSDPFRLKAIENHFKGVLFYAPGMLGNVALNFFLDRFKYQNWLDTTAMPWRPRKAPKWGKKSGQGRALLVLRARLKRSLRIARAGNLEVLISTDVPYARVHNEGFRAGVIQKVGAYERRLTKIAMTKAGKPRMRGGKAVREASGKTTVKAHTRKINQNIPQRQFMGNSQYLTKQLERKLMAEFSKVNRLL